MFKPIHTECRRRFRQSWIQAGGRIEDVRRTGEERYFHALCAHPVRANKRRKDVPAKLLCCLIAGFEGITTAAVKECLREIGNDPDSADEHKLLNVWLELGNRIATLKKRVRDGDAALDTLALEKYPTLSKAGIQALVIDDKWMAALAAKVQGHLARMGVAWN